MYWNGREEIRCGVFDGNSWIDELSVVSCAWSVVSGPLLDFKSILKLHIKYSPPTPQRGAKVL